MKKTFLKLLLVAALVLALPLTLAACGSKGGAEYAGTYKFYSMEYAGETMTAADLEDLGMDPDSFDFSITLEANGDFTMSAMGESVEGTYKVSGTKITFNADGFSGDESYELDGDYLTIEYEGDSVTFKR